MDTNSESQTQTNHSSDIWYNNNYYANYYANYNANYANYIPPINANYNRYNYNTNYYAQNINAHYTQPNVGNTPFFQHAQYPQYSLQGNNYAYNNNWNYYDYNAYNNCANNCGQNYNGNILYPQHNNQNAQQYLADFNPTAKTNASYNDNMSLPQINRQSTFSNNTVAQNYNHNFYGHNPENNAASNGQPAMQQNIHQTFDKIHQYSTIQSIPTVYSTVADKIGDMHKDLHVNNLSGGSRQISSINASAASFIDANNNSSADAIVHGSTIASGNINRTDDKSSNQEKVTQDGFYSTLINESQKGACDNTMMIVPTCSTQKKKLCCLYCKKSYVALARHLATVHKREADVQKFVPLKKGSIERRQILDVLRKKGMKIWNSNASLNRGVLLTCRRPNRKFNKKAIDYNTCAGCWGTYTKKGLRHHVRKRCSIKLLKGQRIIQVLGRAVEGRIDANASDRLRLVVFPKLREDHIVRLIRYDWIIITYANLLCLKYVPHYQHNMIRARLRLIGRLLHIFNGLNFEVTDFSSMYNPRFYDTMLAAIRILGGFNTTTNEFKSPAAAGNVVTLVKQIGVVLVAEYIKKVEPENQVRTENFLKVMQSDISITINKAVTETQSRMRRDKKVIIPSTEDIQKLALFLDQKREKCFNELTEIYSFDTWTELAKFTVASIIVFNRRRTGEIQNILLNDFINRESINEKTNKELFQSLSERSKEIASQYTRLTIRGKLGRPVHVLLKPHVDQCIQLLVDQRKYARIHQHNNFLFALPTSSETDIKVVNACAAISESSDLCGAKDPESLRGTTMRKHMATICISLQLNDNSIAQLADFMGHSEKIHRDIYRQNPIHNEIVKMSQLLEKAQGNDNGNGNDYNGNDDNGKADDDNGKGDDDNGDESNDSDDDDNENQLQDCPKSNGKQHTRADKDVELSFSDLENDFEDALKMQQRKQSKVRKPSAKVQKPSLKFHKASPKRRKALPKDPKPSTINRKNEIETDESKESDDSNEESESDIEERNIPKKKFLKTRYSADELNSMQSAFASNFRDVTLPTTSEIKAKQKLYTPLQNRTWQQIKTWISNQNKKACQQKSYKRKGN